MLWALCLIGLVSVSAAAPSEADLEEACVYGYKGNEHVEKPTRPFGQSTTTWTTCFKDTLVHCTHGGPVTIKKLGGKGRMLAKVQGECECGCVKGVCLKSKCEGRVAIHCGDTGAQTDKKDCAVTPRHGNCLKKEGEKAKCLNDCTGKADGTLICMGGMPHTSLMKCVKKEDGTMGMELEKSCIISECVKGDGTVPAHCDHAYYCRNLFMDYHPTQVNFKDRKAPISVPQIDVCPSYHKESMEGKIYSRVSYLYDANALLKCKQYKDEEGNNAWTVEMEECGAEKLCDIKGRDGYAAPRGKMHKFGCMSKNPCKRFKEDGHVSRGCWKDGDKINCCSYSKVHTCQADDSFGERHDCPKHEEECIVPRYSDGGHCGLSADAFCFRKLGETSVMHELMNYTKSGEVKSAKLQEIMRDKKCSISRKHGEGGTTYELHCCLGEYTESVCSTSPERNDARLYKCAMYDNGHTSKCDASHHCVRKRRVQ